MILDKRWIPVAVAPALVASFALMAPLQASAVDLPDLSVNQVMLLMERGDKVKGFSGTLVKTTNLGLPNLELGSMVTEEMVAEMEENTPEAFQDMIPQITEQSMLTDAISLIAGTHKIRVYSSETGFRSQILDRMGQRDLIVNENEIWLYDFKKSLATTVDISMLKDIELDASTLASLAEGFDEQLVGASAKLQLDLSNPSALVEAFLSDAEKIADISVGKDHKAAGRNAYQLIASPKSENSLVDSIRVSIDAENGFILDLKVYSVEEEEAVVHIGFEDISFQVPEDSMFSFPPPKGATVERLAPLEEAVSGLDPETLDALKSLEENALAKEELEVLYLQLKAQVESQTGSQEGSTFDFSKLDFSALDLTVIETGKLNTLFAELNALTGYSRAEAEEALELLETEIKKAVADLDEKYKGMTVQEVRLELETQTKSLSDSFMADFSSNFLIGTGWGTIITLDSLPSEFPVELLDNQMFAGILKTTSSGRAFSTPLFNILIADDGRVFIGAVTLEYLEKAATR
jgi:outer membrane lipoprotein-sorting protein